MAVTTQPPGARDALGAGGGDCVSLRVLLAAPVWFALFEERGHPLLRVVGERVLRHDELAVLVGGGLAAVDLLIEGVLSRGDGVRAGPGNRFDPLNDREV